jgi:glucose/mannose-6-phosphate isomerase
MIEELQKQLAFEPIVRRPLADIPQQVVVGGMGGSGFVGDILSFLLPDRHIVVHRDYGLPAFAPEDALYIAVSFSGTTEETLNFANEARTKGRRLAVIASGGTLEKFAERETLPFVSVPGGLRPRYALIYMVRAALALIGESGMLASLAAVELPKVALTEEAEELAHFLLPSVPLFYASTRNDVLARLGKIMMNETARTPAFANVFSELNHNEMQAYDTDMPEGLEHLFRFVLVLDESDHPRIRRRMEAFMELMSKRGRMIHSVDISGMNRAEALTRTWTCFLLSARFLAETRDIDPDTNPLIDAFKNIL